MARRIPIDPKTVRYKIAQFFLSILYGRKWHYISPWKHSSVASCVVIVKNGKVLMGKRRGNIENIGIRDNPGGHVDLEYNEDIISACVREVYEEMNIKIDPKKINQNKPIDIHLESYMYIEHTDAINICLTYMYEVSDEELATLAETEESHDFKWFDKTELNLRLQKSEHKEGKQYFERAIKALTMLEKQKKPH